MRHERLNTEQLQRVEHMEVLWEQFLRSGEVRISRNNQIIINEVHQELGHGRIDNGCKRCILNGFKLVMKLYTRTRDEQGN